jgi:hypothetical protein
MVVENNRLVVARAAPRHSRQQLPVSVWMALAKATPVAGLNEDEQGMLGDVVVQLDRLAGLLNKALGKQDRWESWGSGTKDGKRVKDLVKKLSEASARIRAPEDLLTALAFSFEQTNVIVQLDVGAKFAHEPFPGQERSTPPWFAQNLSQIIQYLLRSKSQAVFPGIFVFPAFDANQFDRGLQAFGTPVTGGNVSFYNEGPRGAVDPTPVIGMIGVIEAGSGKRLSLL